MALAPATRLGPYEILQPIDAGGMGEVYRARDTRLERIVAVKILPAVEAGELSIVTNIGAKITPTSFNLQVLGSATP